MILERIQKELNKLSSRQRMVAQYILQNTESVDSFTAAQLAEACSVSEATVIRFANHMGYGRYSDMKRDLQDAVRGTLSQMDRFRRTGDLKTYSSMMQTVIRSMRSDIQSIERTLLSVHEQELSRIVEWIATSRRVYVIGTHSEYGIACYFASTLGWIRDRVYLLDATHAPSFDMVADAGPEDVILAMSFPPYPAATVRTLEAVIRRGAHSVAITDSPLSPLAKRAQHSLYAHDEKLFFADNSAPTVSLLSVLLALVSNYDFKGSSAYLRNRQKYWEEIKFYHQEES